MASSGYTLKLGQSVDLLHGYNATVFSDRNGKIPLKPSAQPALFEKSLQIPNPNPQPRWDDYPVISLHSNTEELLTALQQIKLRRSSFEDDPSQGGGVAVWPAGALMLQGLSTAEHARALADLSAEIGLDLSQPGLSYALVRRSHKIGTAAHPCVATGLFRHVDPQGTERPDLLRALKSLKKELLPYLVGAAGASSYLHFYKTFGTHFISRIDYGDTLFQVFAYGPAEFKTIHDMFERNPQHLIGQGTQYFSQFTVAHNNAGYGFTAAIGKLCLASNDPALATTIASKKWYDSHYALHDSILTPYLISHGVNVHNTFHQNVAIGIELASLSEFAELYRKLIWRQVFKGAMYSRFADGSGVALYFSNNCPYDLDAAYKDSSILEGDGLLSTIATPSVSIFKEHIKLNSIVLEAADTVKYFSTFSNALEISLPLPAAKDKLDIPGSSSVSLVSHVISVEGNCPTPPTILISNTANPKIYCGEFYGGLRLINGSKSLVVINGLLFEVVSGEVTIQDLRASPSRNFISQHLTDFQFSLVAAEARLNFLLSNCTASNPDADLTLMRRYLQWLGGGGVERSTVTATSSLEPVSLQARAIYLAKFAATPSKGAGLAVPYLKYDAYKDTMHSVEQVLQTANLNLASFQTQIRNRKAEERAIDRDSQLNVNIIQSGKLLCNYISAQASYQEDLSAHFTSVVADKEKEINLLTARETSLSTKLREQRIVVRKAVEDYKEAVVRWQNYAEIKSGLDIASGFFSLGFAFVTPASSITALENLGKMVQRVQKTLTVFDALIVTYENFNTTPVNPQHVLDTVSSIGPQGLDLPTSLEWSEMRFNMLAILNTGPSGRFVDRSKNALSAAFTALVLRGQALIEVQNAMQGKNFQQHTPISECIAHRSSGSQISAPSSILNHMILMWQQSIWSG